MRSVDKLPSRYRIENRLGAGGFGEVFRAYDSHLEQMLAIKILPDDVMATSETLTQEFETLSKLQHPNLVKVFDYGTLPSRVPYFTMEVVEGENLRDFLRQKTNYSRIPVIIRQTLNALIYLNKNRILHGDIKPENIVIRLNEDGELTTKLLDFGLTMNLDDEKRRLSGTIRYIAPEILLQGARKSPATDLYALGVSLIESILRKETRRSDTIDEAYFEEVYAALRETLANAGLDNPSALSSFILDLCKPNPADRASNAKEAIRVLETITKDDSPHQEIQIDRIFIGRRTELGEIDKILACSVPGKQVIILSGPQGIGKKSIMGRAAQSAQLKGFLPIDLTPSSDHFSLDQLIDTLSSHLGAEDKKRLFAMMPALEKVKGKSKKIDPDLDKTIVIFAHLIDFLIEVSTSRSLLLVVSDADRHSVDFLHFIVQLVKQMETSNRRIALLITMSAAPARSTVISDALSRIARSPLSEQIEIQPFNDELLKKLLVACFGRTLLIEQERTDLITETQGIPLLISAFLRNLVTANVIQHEAGYWILDRKRYKEVRIPTNLDQSLETTFRNLRREETALLELLGLAGPMLKSDLGAFVQETIRDHDEVLADLASKAILNIRPDGTISFAHPLYSRFIIQTMPASTMRHIAAQLADYLASKHSGDSLRIARLYIMAERVNSAIEYSLDAVDKMFSSYLLFDCLKLLLDLRALVAKEGQPSEVLIVLDRLAPIEHRTGLPREAIRDYESLIRSASNATRRAQYYIQLARIHFGLLGDIKGAQPLLRKALHSAKREGDTALTAAIYQLIADMDIGNCALYYEKAANLSKETDVSLHLASLASLAYNYQLIGRHEKAVSLQKRVLKDLQKADSAAKSRIFYDFYCMSFFTADYKAARYYITKKAQLEKKTESFIRLLASMTSLAGCYYTEGSYYKMIDTLEETHRSAMRYNNYLAACIALSNLSLGFRCVANYGQSLRSLARAEELIAGEGTLAPNVSYLNKPTMLYLVFGECKNNEFMASAQRLYERATKTDNRIGLGHHSIAFALHHLYNLEPDEALPHVKKALAFFRKASDRDDVVHALINLAMIQIARGKPRLAAPHVREATEIYETIHCEYLRPLLLLGTGMLARHERSDDAKKILTEALKVSKKMGTRETTWQIQRELALYHQDQDEPHKALAYYRDAVETIKQITETIDEEDLKLSYLQVPFRKRVFSEIKTLG
jgi:serine/threonine protein kinase/tetratricopeptide (TPR) repeat protein